MALEATSFIKERYNPFRVEHGKRLHFETADYRELLAPWDRSRIAMIGYLNEEQAFENLKTLRQTFISGKIPKTFERIAILRKAARRIDEKKSFFADLIAWEGGKPLRDAQAEVTRAINSLEIAADEAGRVAGDEIPMMGTKAASGRVAFTFPEPIGVVFAISAFNHPLNLIAHQVAPAIAVGCPVMIKPASETPLSCLHMLEELYEAGLPPEMCLPLLADNEVAEKIAKSPLISFMSFIGSAKVGWHLRSVLNPGTRFSLEHGGSAPVIVDSSADLDLAIPTLIKGAYYHSGQVCVSVQRIWVQEDLFPVFQERFVSAVQNLNVGDARLEKTDCGPMIRVKDVERVASWIKEAVSQGSRLLTGGKVLSPTTYAPTVLSHTHAEQHVMKDEVFGPLACINPYKNLPEAIDLANQVDWNFQSAIFTRDLEQAMLAARKLNASAVMINESTTFRVDWMPFRGDGPSGFGTGGIPFAMRDMTREKLVVIKTPTFDR